VRNSDNNNSEYIVLPWLTRLTKKIILGIKEWKGCIKRNSSQFVLNGPKDSLKNAEL